MLNELNKFAREAAQILIRETVTIIGSWNLMHNINLIQFIRKSMSLKGLPSSNLHTIICTPALIVVTDPKWIGFTLPLQCLFSPINQHKSPLSYSLFSLGFWNKRSQTSLVFQFIFHVKPQLKSRSQPHSLIQNDCLIS